MSKAPPPRLHFDDGSRIITENTSSQRSTTATELVSSSSSVNDLNPRGLTPIEIYYEINRVASEIVDQIVIKSPSTETDTDGFMCKVALQFPDELLNDAAEVSWLMEDAILAAYNEKKKENENEIVNENENEEAVPPLVFILGDTTYSSCCPDEIGALHLSADVIVHYGQYACLSPSQCLPVIYSFGVLEWVGMEECINTVLQHVDNHDKGENDSDNGNDDVVEKTKILLLCERQYHQYMEDISLSLAKNDNIQDVIIGSLPMHDVHQKNKMHLPISSSCCGGDGNGNGDDKASSSCCKEGKNEASKEGTPIVQKQNDGCCNSRKSCKTEPSNIAVSNSDDNEENDNDNANSNDNDDYDDQLNIGGLQVPIDPSQLPKYTLLYIGDDSGTSKSRQFLNTILRCSSPTYGTKQCWSYNPQTKQLSTDPSSMVGMSRYLNRRFYLTQKAQLASIIGILVGTLSQDRFRNVISSVRTKIQDSGRSCYTFVVGKINVAKLANFAEVECFVLISCGETSVLQDERDFHLPVITPTELEIVLGEKGWNGSDSCNTNFGDFLKGNTDGDDNNNNDNQDKIEDGDDGEGGDNDEDDDDTDGDEPFFSMISGTYVSKPISQRRNTTNKNGNDDGVDAINSAPGSDKALPGESQMVEYKSSAAEFWKQREYKGLEAKIGQTEVKAATKGQTGIASDYGK